MPHTRKTLLGHATCRPRAVERTDTTGSARASRAGITLPGTIALALLVLGGINWGLVGIAGVDAIAWLFGPASVVTRAVEILIGVAAIYCLVHLPRWSRAG